MFTGKELSALSGVEVFIIDRAKLPYEEKFTSARRPSFSNDELRKRGIAAYLMIRGRPDDISEMATFSQNYGQRTKKPSANCYSDSQPGPWSDNARQIGLKFFGAQYEELAKLSNSKTTLAVILPSSPFLSLSDTWETSIGFKVENPPSFRLDDIYTLHELGHVLYSFPDQGGPNKIGRKYTNEAMADIFALKTYRERGGEEEHIQAFVDARRIDAFLGKVPEYYNTAHACDASLAGKPIPSYYKSFHTMRELQLSVLSELTGQDCLTRQRGNASLFRAAAEIFETEKKTDLWTASNEEIIKRFAPFGVSRVMTALDKVIESPPKISAETLAEAKECKRAFGYFVLGERAPVKPKTTISAPSYDND